MQRRLLAALCAAALATAHAADAPKPQYGAWGYDLTGIDTSVAPGDDFFRYANGAWIARTEIPADKSATSLRLAMSDTVEQRLHDLLDTAAKTAGPKPTTLAAKAGAFYAAYMDEARIDAAGAKPIAPQLDAVRNAATRDALAALMGHANADFNGSLFNLTIDVDLKEPTRYAIYVGQSGLGLPNRDYYLEAGFARQKDAYGKYLATLLELVNWPEPAQAAQDVLAFETDIAQASWSITEQRDPTKLYNPMTLDELAAFAPGFAWKDYFAQAGLGAPARIVGGEKTAFPKLVALYAKTPLPVLKAWSAAHIADNASFYLSKPFQDARFELHNRTLSGQQAQGERWKRAVHAVAGGDYLSGARYDAFGNFGWGVGRLYAEKYFPPASKAKIEALVAHLKAAFRARIEHLDWMGDATRAQALKKLETYVIKVGYPDHPRDQSGLDIRADDLVGNVLRAAAADWKFVVDRRNGPVDKSDWAMTPQTNDAYNGALRDIVFPAGILQPPMFDPDADPAVNYGAIGGVIGHELSHGFDDQGRKIDADGALRDWWTAADAKAFEERAAKLAAQYSRFEPLPGVHVNGELTLGENIADAGGLTLALEAYHASLAGKPAPVLDGYTGDQRVFLGWAQAWRGKLREDALKRQVVSDPHSPRQYRVNGVVRDIEAWYSAFEVKPGQALYLKPEERVRIW